MQTAPNLPLKVSSFPACRGILPTQATHIYFPSGEFISCLRGKAILSPKQIRRILPFFFLLFHFIFFICGHAGKLHPLKTYYVCTRLPNFKAQFTRIISTIIKALGRAFPSSFVFPPLAIQYGARIVSSAFCRVVFRRCGYCLPYLLNEVAASLHGRTFN